MTEEQNTFKNDHVEVNVTRNPGCQVSMTVQVTPAAVQAAYKKAVKTVNKEVSLPGFRKGKSPAPMIIKHYAPQIEREWKDMVMQNAFAESTNLSSLYPTGKETIKRPTVNKCSAEEGAEIVFEFETEPNVPDVDSSGLEVKPEEAKEVTTEDIEESIILLQEDFGDLVELEESRPAAEGDYVKLDISIIEDPERTLCEDKLFHVKDKRMGVCMRILTVGLSAGESAEGDSEVEEGAPDYIKEKFEARKCRITVKSILSMNLAPIDEKFAERLGVETVEEINSRVGELLVEERQRQAEQALKAQVESYLLTKYPFDVPASLIQAELQSRVRNQIRSLTEAGHTQDEIRDQQKEIEVYCAVEVDKALRLYYLLRKIAAKESINVSEQELWEEIAKQMWRTPASEKVIDPEMKPEEIRARVMIHALSEKVKLHLIEQAKVA